MSADNFTACLKIILREEGGNDDDPVDPGGRTSRGITQREWNVYRQTHANLPSDVWKAPQADIEAIYKEQYWNPYCDRMPGGIDLMFFNTSVLSGRTQAVKELQRSLGKVADDGMMGMLTWDALAKAPDIKGLIENMSEQRRAYYRRLKTFWKFGKGWLARTDRVEAASLKLADQVPVPIPPEVPEERTSARADPDQVSNPAMPPEATGTASAGAGTLAGMLDQIKETLGPFADTIKYVQYVLLGIAIIGIGYTVYAAVKRSRNQQVAG